MPQDTQVNDLKINVLTEAQYEQIQSPSPTELYLVPEIIDTTPTEDSTNPITSGGVYNALQNISTPKQNNKIIALRAIPANTALAGNRYFFSKNIKIRTKEQLSINISALNNEEVANGQPITLLKPQNDGFAGYLYVIRKDVFLDSDGEYEHNDFLQHPCVVTIPNDFDAARFITDAEYRNSLVSRADNLCTQDMASPYFEIKNGYVICTKMLPVACGRPAKNKEIQNDFIKLLGINAAKAKNVAFRYKKKYRFNGVADKTTRFQAMTDWRIGVYRYRTNPIVYKRALTKRRTFDFAARHRGKRSIHVVTLFHKKRFVVYLNKHIIWTVANIT